MAISLFLLAHSFYRKSSTLKKVDIPVFDPVPLQVFRGHKSDILDICWSHKSEFVLSAALDKSVRLWHVRHENCLREFPHVNYVTSIRFHPLDAGRFISGRQRGSLFACIQKSVILGSGDGVLRLWNIAEYKVVASASIASEKDIFTALCFSADGRTIVAGCFDGTSSHVTSKNNDPRSHSRSMSHLQS